MNDHRYMNSTVANQAAIDEGLRSYMLGVYNYLKMIEHKFNLFLIC